MNRYVRRAFLCDEDALNDRRSAMYDMKVKFDGEWCRGNSQGQVQHPLESLPTQTLFYLRKYNQNEMLPSKYSNELLSKNELEEEHIEVNRLIL